MPQPIQISVSAGTIHCTPSAGNVSARAGEVVEWKPGDNVGSFRLRFFKVPAQGNSATSDWPFSKASAAQNDSVSSFKGILDDRPGGIYKYTVEVQVEGQTYFLDPMIIIGG